MEILICTQLLFLSKAIWIRNDLLSACTLRRANAQSPGLSGLSSSSVTSATGASGKAWRSPERHKAPREPEGAELLPCSAERPRVQRCSGLGTRGVGWAPGAPVGLGRPLVCLQSRGGSVAQNVKPTLLPPNGERLIGIRN